LEISYNNGDPANSTDLSLLQKITFSGTDITFLLTDNSSVTKALSTIDKITFSGMDGGNELPVELVSFSAVVKGNEVILEWSTATEVDNYGFEVERKAPLNLSEGETSGKWEKIGFVEGHGNSNSPKQYSFTDEKITAGTYKYRLKQIDNDGKYEYSSVVSIDLNAPNQYALNQNYPNPFNPSTIISYTIPINGFVTLKVFDVLGQEIITLLNEEKPVGSYEVEFNTKGLPSGIYFYRLQAGNFIQTKKMVLMK